MKNKALGFMALASCVMLAGCGKDPENNAVITIKDFTTPIYLGDTVDLGDYIEVSGGKGNYYINFDDETFEKISVSDDSETEITVNNFGAIKFSVEYSGKSLAGQFNVSSKILEEYAAVADNAGYDFTAMTFDFQEGYVSGVRNFGEKFYYDQYFEQETNILGQLMATPGGFVEAPDGIVYGFREDDSGELSFIRTSNAPEDISEYVSPYIATSSNFKPIVEERLFGLSNEMLECTDPAIVAEILKTLSGWSVDILVEDYGAQFTRAFVEKTSYEDFFGEDYGVESEACYVITTFAEFPDDVDHPTEFEEELLDFVFVDFNAENMVCDSIKEFVESGEEVVKPDISSGLTLIKNAFAEHNFSVQYDYSWYGYNSKGKYVAIESNPFVASNEGYIREYFNAKGSFTGVVTEDQTYIDNNGLVEGYVNHEGEAFRYYKDDSTYKAVPIGEEDFHDATDIRGTYAFMEETDGELFEDIFANSIQTSTSSGTTKISLTWETLTSSDLFKAICYGAIPKSDLPAEYSVSDVNSLDRVMAFINEVDSERTEYFLADFFTVECEMTVVSNKLTSMKISFVWEDYLETETEDIDYDYRINVTYTFGGASVPGGIDIIYPVK